VIHFNRFQYSGQAIGMGNRLNILRAIRDIALDGSMGEHPDLASMARELGSLIHRDAQQLSSRLAPLRARKLGFERWLVAERIRPDVSILVMAWPANYATPVHDHGGLWGLEVALSGALEVETYSRGVTDRSLRAQGRTWLGPGDATWFDASDDHLHRCRNLSRKETALTLHVYGGNLAQYLAYEQPGPAAHWIARPRRSEIAGRLPA
jgi:predicted metal-dependent enzyme (double-stranded beta helix superfamily)